VAVFEEERGLGLRDAAAAGVGEIPIEQVARDQRAGDRDEDAAPRGAAGGVELAAEVLGEDDKQHHREPDHRADDQGEDEQDLIFVPIAVGHAFFRC